jgi:hypothetical protein
MQSQQVCQPYFAILSDMHVMRGISPLLTLTVCGIRGGGRVINTGASGQLAGCLVGCRWREVGLAA